MLFIEFYEKSYKKDQNNLLNLIQLLQYVINENSVQYYNFENINKFLNISFNIFNEKNTLMKNSISLALTQLFFAYCNFLNENKNYEKIEYKENLETLHKITEVLLIQLEEKSKTLLNDAQIFKERLIMKMIFSIFIALKDDIHNFPTLSDLLKKNFYLFIKNKFNLFNQTSSLSDLHYLLISTSYLVILFQKFDLLLLVSQIENDDKTKKNLSLLIKEMYISIFEKERTFFLIVDYNYLIIMMIIEKLHLTNKIQSDKINYHFDFYDSSLKLSFEKIEENVLNLNIIEKIINIFMIAIQEKIDISQHSLENISSILLNLEKILKKFGSNQLKQSSMSYRNILFQNLFKISGELLKQKPNFVYKNQIIEFFNKEITNQQNMDKFGFEKTLNLKSLLNMGVCLNEYMNKDNWVICIISYLKYSSDEKKIKTDELDEYIMLNNSFKSLFLASDEYDVKVLEDIIKAVKEIILVYDLLKEEYFHQLLIYLENIFKMNYFRINLFLEIIFEMLLSMIDNIQNLVIKFAIDLLGVFINFIFKESLAEEEKTKNGQILDKFFLLFNILIQKKNMFIYNQLFLVLELIVDVNGYDLEAKFWKLILQKIHEILQYYESQEIDKNFSKNVFELIQKINANYLNFLNRECLLLFIQILKLFIAVTDSKNYKYGVIEYFYTISDNMSKKFIDDIHLWTQLFSFLHTNSEETDAEIRNTSLNIFAGIINNYGFDFCPEIWEFIMEKIYLKSFDNIIEIYFNLVREEMRVKNFSDTPNFILKLKNDFEINKKNIQNNKPERMISSEDLQTISLQWQETIRILIQSFNRILTKYLQYNKKSKIIIEKMFEKSFYLFRITSKNIFNDVTIVIKNILASKVISSKMKTTLFCEIESWLKRNQNQGQAVHDLMVIIAGVFNDLAFLNQKENFEIILKIYIQIVYFSAFCNEYSTYFYNLEKMCKKFLEDLFDFIYQTRNQNCENDFKENEKNKNGFNKENTDKVNNQDVKEIISHLNSDNEIIKKRDSQNYNKLGMMIGDEDEIYEEELHEKITHKRNENTSEELINVFIKYIPEIFCNKVKNKKANTICLILLEVLMQKIEKKLDYENFSKIEELISSLFIIYTHIQSKGYNEFMNEDKNQKNREDLIYLLFNKKLANLFKQIIILKSIQGIEFILNLSLKEFIIFKKLEGEEMKTKRRKKEEKITFKNEKQIALLKNEETVLNEEEIKILCVLEINICEEVSIKILTELKDDYQKYSGIVESFLVFFKNFQNQSRIKRNLESDFFDNFNTISRELLCQNISELNYHILLILNSFLKSLLKNLVVRKINDNEKNQNDLKFKKFLDKIKIILEIFLNFKSEKVLNEILVKKFDFKNLNFRIENNQKIHLLIIYNDVLSLLQFNLEVSLNAYVIEFFDQVSKNFLFSQTRI